MSGELQLGHATVGAKDSPADDQRPFFDCGFIDLLMTGRATRLRHHPRAVYQLGCTSKIHIHDLTGCLEPYLIVGGASSKIYGGPRILTALAEGGDRRGDGDCEPDGAQGHQTSAAERGWH